MERRRVPGIHVGVIATLIVQILMLAYFAGRLSEQVTDLQERMGRIEHLIDSRTLAR